jgi:pentapeptide MXKDX repeat protein
MKKVCTTILAGCMFFAMAGAYADDMKKDEMKKDGMMKKEAMKKDGMMKKDAMKKDSAMGKEEMKK